MVGVLLHITGSAATVHLDVLGWYGDAQHTTGGSLYHAVTPRRRPHGVGDAEQERGLGRCQRPGRHPRRGSHVGNGRARDPGGRDGRQPERAETAPPRARRGGRSPLAPHATGSTRWPRWHPTAVGIRLHVTGGSATVAIRALGYTTARAAGGSYLKFGSPTRVDSFTTGTAARPMRWAGWAASHNSARSRTSSPSTRKTRAPRDSSAWGRPRGCAARPDREHSTAHVDVSGAPVTVGNENDAVRYQTSAGSTGTRVDLQGWYVG